jgi:fused signal recognition particle receptor
LSLGQLLFQNGELGGSYFMEEVFLSLRLLQQNLLGFLGMEGEGPEEWLLVSLGSVLLLIVYLSFRYVVSRRQPGTPYPEILSSTLQVSEAESTLGDEPVSSAGAAASGREHDIAGGMPDEGPDGQAGPVLLSPEAVLRAEERMPSPSLPEDPPGRLLERLRGRLTKTHDQLIGRLDQIFLRTSSIEPDLLEELEEVLVTADLGVKTSYELVGEVQRQIGESPLTPSELKATLRTRIRSMLDIEAHAFEPDRAKPFVIMVVGVNGVGKTTSIGKLAARLKEDDRGVMLVAADTFRAAAIEQLEIWSRRVGADFVKHKPESDPSAVVYDAMQAAKSRKSDLVIVDTAGRLHTKTNLMEELKKVKRIMDRELEGAPHEILLVVDATTGQNAINQARTFHEAIGVTGIILTKLDGTAKGGVIVGIANELQLPVRFIGIGEQIDDLREFSADLFLEAIFAEPTEGLVH